MNVLIIALINTKESSMSEFDRRQFLKTVAAATVAGAAAGCTNKTTTKLSPAQGQSVMGLTVAKMDVVRVAFIGVGQRGSGHVKHFVGWKVLKLRLFAILTRRLSTNLSIMCLSKV